MPVETLNECCKMALESSASVAFNPGEGTLCHVQKTGAAVSVQIAFSLLLPPRTVPPRAVGLRWVVSSLGAGYV